MANAVSLETAIGNVQRLEQLPLPDEQPNIEAHPTSIVYDVSFDTNFEDRQAFVTALAKFLEEATVHRELVKSNDQQNRREIYEMAVEVLGPEVSKLIEFRLFIDQAISAFAAQLKSLAHENKRKDFISGTYLLTLAKFVNMFASLDALKNMKSSLNNDLAFYKRADSFLRTRNITQNLVANVEQLQYLSLFLATTNKITLQLQEAVEAIPNYEEVLGEVVNFCCMLLETKFYILPREKHMLLKAIGFNLFLMDGKMSNIYKLDSKKKISLQRVDRLFKQVPMVPISGDIPIALVSYVKQSPHYNASYWSCASEQAEIKASSTHFICSKIDTIRSEHQHFISELSRASTTIVSAQESGWTEQLFQYMSDLALRGLQLISGWTTMIIETYAWKLLHPADRFSNRECPESAEEYERAVRYNYSSDEKFAMVEIIAMIKGLTVLLRRLEVPFMEAIKRYVHQTLQRFVQVTLRESIRHAIKKKKLNLKLVLFAIRDVSVDWHNGQENTDDPCLKGEKDPKGGYHIKLSERGVAPSSTQLYMCRTMVESIISEKSGKKSLRYEIDNKAIADFEEFHKKTFFFPYLLSFTTILQEASDLSQLWYREFFLELTNQMNKRVQFPIEMSLPWILTDHILQTKEPSMMEYLLYPLDLYSDASHSALHQYKKQFLYDEAEAEVNLAFDQFIYKISEQIFIHYKSLACSILLDKKFRSEYSQQIPLPPANRYSTILKQRHVQILGRSIDLNRLICQRLTDYLLRALNLAIGRFESNDLTYIIELENLLETNKLTHDLLSKYVALDPFEALFREANQNVNLPHGRISLHCFWEINMDFMPNWCYNSTTGRFVRTKLLLSEPVERSPPPRGAPYFFYGNRAIASAYTSINQLTITYIGAEHFAAMSRLLGYQGIAMIMEELIKQTNIIIKNTLVPYITALSGGMPKRCRRPLADYGAQGVFQFYAAQLEAVIQYPTLRTDVCQSFREIGNSLLFCLLMEQCLSQEEVLDLLQAAPFQGILPQPFLLEGQSRELSMQSLQKQWSSLKLVSIISKYGTPMQLRTAKDSDLLTKERLCRGLSMFEVVLGKVHDALKDESVRAQFVGPPPSNGVCHVEECVEFFRLWSAVQLVLCMPLNATESSPEEVFGDGLHWAGMTIVYLLDQLQRFEVLDFAYHILRLSRSLPEREPKKEQDDKQDLRRMVERIRWVQMLNNNIVAVLDKHLCPPSEAASLDAHNPRKCSFKSEPVYYPPPAFGQDKGSR